MISFKSIVHIILIGLFSIILASTISAQEKLHLENFTGIPANTQIYDIAFQNNLIWVTTNKGLYEIDQSTNESNIHLNGKKLQTLVLIDKKAYIANNNEILDLQGNVLCQLGENVIIKQIELYNKNLWLGTNDGVYVVSRKNLVKKKHYTKDNSRLKDNNINILHRDTKNIMWIGTDRGYVRIDEKWNKTRDKKSKVLSISENKEGVWLLNDKELIFTFYDGRGNEIGLNEGLSKGPVKDIAVNNNNKIYIASNILIGLDPYSDKSNNLGDEIALLSKQVTKMKFDPKGFLWVGTQNSGLFKLTIEKLEEIVVNNHIDEFKENKQLNLVIVVTKDIKCNDSTDGELKAEPIGGTPPYRYAWTNGETTQTISNVGPGEYQVIISDAVNDEFSRSLSIAAPEAMEIIVSNITGVKSQYGRTGKATIKIVGGAPKYSVKWDKRKGELTNKNLTRGNHTVYVIDANGCKGEVDFEITSPKILKDLSIGKLMVGQTLPIKKLYFQSDSTKVNESSYEVLDEIFSFLSSNHTVLVEIGGHTNDIPPHQYCDKLSTMRAKNIVDYLVDKGIESERLKYKGYGKRNPIVSNKTTSGRRKNQRVEIKILGL